MGGWQKKINTKITVRRRCGGVQSRRGRQTYFIALFCCFSQLFFTARLAKIIFHHKSEWKIFVVNTMNCCCVFVAVLLFFCCIPRNCILCTSNAHNNSASGVLNGTERVKCRQTRGEWEKESQSTGDTVREGTRIKMKISKISQQWANCIMQFICYLIFWYRKAG